VIFHILPDRAIGGESRRETGHALPWPVRPHLAGVPYLQ
jgi:hypothetical protein